MQEKQATTQAASVRNDLYRSGIAERFPNLSLWYYRTGGPVNARAYPRLVGISECAAYCPEYARLTMSPVRDTEAARRFYPAL